MSTTTETKLQITTYKVGERGPYQKCYVRLPSKWIKKLGLEKGAPLTLELLPEGILIKKG